MKKIAIFASGEGTNLQALIDAVGTGQIPGKIVLVLSSSPSARALARAQEAGIPTAVLDAKSFPDTGAYAEALVRECKKRGVELVCLAGFMHRLGHAFIDAFRNRILNIHPGLIPAFCGKGMYGAHVHEAVIKEGVKISGCTVHFVDEGLDTGPIIIQHPVPVLAGDTPKDLAARVLEAEHRAYPEAVRLFCEDRLEISGRVVTVLPLKAGSASPKKRAIVSVSDKEGLVEFCKALARMNVEIISTSGTAKALKDAGIPVRLLENLTGFPEILSGRVKTLHPKVHGGILMRRRNKEDMKDAAALGLEPIDMVVVNLYPFAKTASGARDPFSQDVIEQIDIGGVTLIRAAAKNYDDVAIVVSPQDYAPLIKEMERSKGTISLETRRRLAVSAFRHTAEYDAMIRDTWSRNGTVKAELKEPSRTAELFPENLSIRLKKAQDLRYGENPHQQAALYVREGASGKTSFDQLHGKELSYNNLLDASGAWEAVCDFERPAVVIFKHVTPCGAAVGKTLFQAFEKAWASDPLSAFGGIMALNRPFTKDIADAIAKRFLEVIVAPSYEPEALASLKQKQNLRILLQKSKPSRSLQFKTIGEEVLVTEPDREIFGKEFKAATKRKPTKEEEEALRFAWTAAKHVKSNAIVLASPDATVGIGAGQMSRVDSVHMAGVKFKIYLQDNPKPKTLVLASDAFFPFRDGIDAAATLGISALIQPGGSVRDAEVIAAADEHGLAMVLTGMRHFRH